MDATILNVGTELLMGTTLNTHSNYLSEKLNELGVNVKYHAVVGDNQDRLIDIIKYYLTMSDMIITTGGLGPTEDDITKEVVCEALGVKMEMSEDILDGIKERFKKFGSTMTDNNKKQALVPVGSHILENLNGTAPGFIVTKGEKKVILLPGPPKELYPMFENEVMPVLKKNSNVAIYSDYVKMFGVGESLAEHTMRQLVKDQTNPTLATYVKDGELMIRVTSSGSTIEECKSLNEPVIKELYDLFGDSIFTLENKSLSQYVTEKLIEDNITIAAAESCSGGLISSALVDVAGVSSIFLAGLVTYSNDAKMKLLGVKEGTLARYGAVSEEVAIEMVNGLYRETSADICVSTTGIAGPTGGTKEKPVGLVYIAVKYKGKILCKELNLFGNRDRIRQYTVLNIFNEIRKLLRNENI